MISLPPLVDLLVSPDRAKRLRQDSRAWPSWTHSPELPSSCRAVVFGGDEDFGIVPVEASAHGAPVVGLNKGGLIETMQPGVTAELFDEQNVDVAAGAVVRALGREWDLGAMRRNAARFSPDVFRSRLRYFLDRVTTSSPVEAGA